jgi:hypothetical protein
MMNAIPTPSVVIVAEYGNQSPNGEKVTSFVVRWSRDLKYFVFSRSTHWPLLMNIYAFKPKNERHPKPEKQGTSHLSLVIHPQSMTR